MAFRARWLASSAVLLTLSRTGFGVGLSGFWTNVDSVPWRDRYVTPRMASRTTRDADAAPPLRFTPQPQRVPKKDGKDDRQLAEMLRSQSKECYFLADRKRYYRSPPRNPVLYTISIPR